MGVQRPVSRIIEDENGINLEALNRIGWFSLMGQRFRKGLVLVAESFGEGPD